MNEANARYEQVYAIVRFQAIHARDRGQLRQRDFAVVKIVRTEESAQEEVQRLNSLNRRKGCAYFYQATRMERAAINTDSARP
jgi:hypothetical protein